MKTSLLVAIVLVLVFHVVEGKFSLEQVKKMGQSVRKSCAKKLKAPSDLLDQPLSGIFPNDPTLKCYMDCVLAKMKGIKKGRLDMADLLQQSTQVLEDAINERVQEVVPMCEQRVNSKNYQENCEPAFQFVKCCYENGKEYYFFP